MAGLVASLLCGQPSKKVQHLSEAMLAAIASSAVIGAAVLTIVSGGGGGGNEGGGGGGVVRVVRYPYLDKREYGIPM
jgi:hypothetical protein